ncbi:hypothetical protein JZ751_009240 [Albula glossodonta]|uniref:Protein yippee-like n=1 Tax=Albula glossodonta TaxID=121402 RepID=A0A8T2N894_9TELE|nr:hypothetical protein JZ751_009240 [Albula glossodonta]
MFYEAAAQQSFQGSQGRAYLFNSVPQARTKLRTWQEAQNGVIEFICQIPQERFPGSAGTIELALGVNVGCGPAEERVLLTGLHAVADIYCENCKTTLGWKYEHAFESSQKYKEGKFIIELAHMIKDNGWE